MQELGLLSMAILPIMKDPEVSREDKRKVLCAMVDELKEDTFKRGFWAKMIMGLINMKEEVCKEYEDAEAQTDGILSWLPRMEQHRDSLLKEVKKNRKQFGLKV